MTQCGNLFPHLQELSSHVPLGEPVVAAVLRHIVQFVVRNVEPNRDLAADHYIDLKKQEDHVCLNYNSRIVCADKGNNKKKSIRDT